MLWGQSAAPNLKSKRQLQRQLTDSRIAVRRRDCAEAPVGLVLLWIAEVRVVQHVEELRAELQLQRLMNWEHPNNARIPRGILRSDKTTLHDVAVSKRQVRRV